MSELERRVEISPAYDKRDPHPSKNYGIHGADMRFVLIGPKGAVQFLIFTGWHLPHVQKELDGKVETGRTPARLLRPMAADVGYHSRQPMYEGHKPIGDEPCPYLDAPCYYDGSGMRAEEVFDLMVEKGGEAMWEHLEGYYEDIFGEEEK